MGATQPTRPAGPLPLLLRAFRRVPGTDRPAQVSVLHGEQVLDDWAPATVMHAVRALAACDMRFEGPVMLHRTTASVPATLRGRRYVVTRRMETSIAHAMAKEVANWKVRCGLQVSYPSALADTIHLGWEAVDNGTEPLDDGNLVAGAVRRGLLDPAAVPQGATAEESVHARLEWAARLKVAPFVIFLQLRLRLQDVSAEAFHGMVAAAPRPRRPQDVPRWLAEVGAKQAEWRVEIELIPPICAVAITRALYLHHLLRETVAPDVSPLSRTAFVVLFKRHICQPCDSAAAFGRAALVNLCTQHHIPHCCATGYPMQQRPHDLVPRDLERLNACAATPKADGREAFLVGHAFGYAIIERSGVVRSFRWADRPLFPLLLEGEVVACDTTGDLLFMAYDCAVSPAAAYTLHGQLETRHAAVQAIVRRLGLATVRCKPFYAVEPHPHRALEACVSWAKATHVPCDGVVFADASRPGYCAQGPRLWKVKHVPTIDFALHRVPGGQAVFELMLRGAPGCVQSLHRFRSSHDGFEYRLPVLLAPPLGLELSDGDVVELGLSVDRDWDSRQATVHFPTMHVRERGKTPNCLVGGMDLAANGMTLDTDGPFRGPKQNETARARSCSLSVRCFPDFCSRGPCAALGCSSSLPLCVPTSWRWGADAEATSVCGHDTRWCGWWTSSTRIPWPCTSTPGGSVSRTTGRGMTCTCACPTVDCSASTLRGPRTSRISRAWDRGRSLRSSASRPRRSSQVPPRPRSFGGSSWAASIALPSQPTTIWWLAFLTPIIHMG